MKSTTYLSTLLTLISYTSVNAQWLVDSQAATVREIEHLFLDAAPHNLKSFISPCSQYIDSSTGNANPKFGRQTAAEWIRTGFHDMINANRLDLSNPSGGVDASLGFELARVENKGTAFNDALINYSYFYNARVSMADLIALGVTLASGHCGGTTVNMRAGRIDANAAGPAGNTPLPEQDPQTQLTFFAQADFPTDDAISLTACGHTMGGVHKSDFPEIINQNPAPSGPLDGSDGRVAFDTSVDKQNFDQLHEYLTGTGGKGGPLVTTSNTKFKSDFRLYNLNGNSTVTRLAQSNDYFSEQCGYLFQRMIEVVPNTVRFSPTINPSAANANFLKPFNVDLNIDWKGQMTLTGSLRYVQASGVAKAPASYTVKLYGRNNKITTTQVTATKSATDVGTNLFGPTYSYKFQLKFPSTTGVGGIDVNGQKFTFQDAMFVVPGLSSVSPTPPPFDTKPSMNAQQAYTANLTVAYLPTSGSLPTTLSATYSIPVPQTGTPNPKIDTSTKATLKLVGKVGGYGIYSAKTTKTLSAKQIWGLSVDATATGQSPGGIGFYKVFNPGS